MYFLVRLACVALLLGMSVSSAPAQDTGHGAPVASSPAWIVARFFSRQTFTSESAYVTPSFAKAYGGDEWIGADLAPNVQAQSRELLDVDGYAVYETALQDSADTTDWYTYLTHKEGRWRIEAIATLLFPPIHYEMLASLTARKELPDSLHMIRDRLLLAIRSDSALRQFLRENRSSFEQAATSFAAARGLQAIAEDGTTLPSAILSDSLREVMLHALERIRIGAAFIDGAYPRCIFFKIGGAGSTAVGYIFSGNGCTPPRMTPERFIYVEAVDKGWLVYKHR